MAEVQKLQEEGDFQASFGVNAKVPGPVAPAGGEDKSNASKKGKPEMPMEKLQGVQEHLDALFDGTDLSEEFKEKAAVIFEAAINEKATEVAQSLEEQYQAAYQSALEEEVAAIQEALVDKIDSYLDYVVEQWVEENKLAIESGIKAEVVESFMEGLKGLFAEHYIEAPEDKVDVLDAVSKEVDDLNSKLSEVVNENIELSRQLSALSAEKAISEAAAGLPATQAEKLRTLAEGIDYSDLGQFERKLNMIKETYFSGKKATDAQQQLNEEVAAAPAEPTVDPVMQKYAAAISRSVKN